MGSELKKPDRVHTLFLGEIADKIWPLDVSELFMVGRATTKKLKKINIKTIGDLARADVNLLRTILKSHGQLVWEYANGIDDSAVALNDALIQKSIGNSTTMAFDVDNEAEAKHVILALCERVGMRLRNLRCKTSLVSVHVSSAGFMRYRHQVQLQTYINSTSDIYEIACTLLLECWKGEPSGK